VTFAEALALVASQRVGVLVTVRRDGRPQTSNVVYALDGHRIRISVTEDRAKTRNLRRDPRAVLHVSSPDLSAWAALDGTAELSPTTTIPSDATGQALAELHTAIAGREHPDWAEYHRAMVEERRLIITLTATSGYGGKAG
jgi:PPOX class probable F420-dependent enzyme